MQAWSWDIFCRVIDNFGDVGVCWRLAAALGRRGQAVRLWIDRPAALAWLAPQGAPGVAVIHWTDTPPDLEPGAVVVEAFGCEPPAGFITRMAQRPAQPQPPPVWINLEYLSAEPYVERSHRLPSPQFSGPGKGLSKWFFYPGFTPATGGLLQDDAEGDRVHDPKDEPADARAWAAALGWGAATGGRTVLVFCYDNPALPGLLQSLAAQAGPQPTRLLLPPGPARAQVQALALPPALQPINLPYLAQPDFDRLIASTDLNLVRGEDSFVRAQVGADSPFLWQIYPQADGAHAPKLEAFLDQYLEGAAPAVSPADALAVRQAFRVFNGLAAGPLVLPEATAWQVLHRAWRARLHAQTDLCSQLLHFAQRHRLAESG